MRCRRSSLFTAFCRAAYLATNCSVLQSRLSCNKLLGAQETFDTRVNAVPNTYTRACKVVIENGDLDDRVTEQNITEFREEMAAAQIDWQLHNHR